MANVLYDKDNRYPPAGSLREALFLHVWLRRQAIAVESARMLAQGLANKDNVEFLIKAHESLVAKMLPYLKETKKATDKEMVAALKKEVAQGRIEFKVMDTDHNKFLRSKATLLSAPDEYRAKLAAGVQRRKNLGKPQRKIEP
jgi:hypothetical protein